MMPRRVLWKLSLWGGLLLLALIVAFGVMRAGFLVPTTPPPPLQITPVGAPVVIDGDTYQTASFRAWIPPAWTVVKLSAIGEEERVAFIAPDEQTAIIISHAPLNEPDTRRIEQLAVAGRVVYVALLSAEAPAEDVLALFETVLASIAPVP
ncbi:MAG: hypothetical protein D6712_16065 [Chloroflexi bacterium]|nr:MAG: hypothetical protein D6712_16065 [Chloroflexota bacterium]